MIENEKITGLLNVIQLSNDATKIPSTKRPEYHILLGKKKVRSIDKLYPACSEFHEIAQTIMKVRKTVLQNFTMLYYQLFKIIT